LAVSDPQAFIDDWDSMFHAVLERLIAAAAMAALPAAIAAAPVDRQHFQAIVPQCLHALYQLRSELARELASRRTGETLHFSDRSAALAVAVSAIWPPDAREPGEPSECLAALSGLMALALPMHSAVRLSAAAASPETERPCADPPRWTPIADRHGLACNALQDRKTHRAIR
jgi:hypothetical protein